MPSTGGMQGVSAPHHCRLAAKNGPVRVGEDDRPRRIFWAQAREVPSGGADRVEPALSSARAYGTPALDDGHLSLALWRLSSVRRETHQEDQWPTTYPAAPFLRGGGPCLVTIPGWGTLRSRVVTGAGREERPDLREHFATARAQDAVGADFDEPPWQHMLEEAVDECFGGQRQTVPPSAAALLEAERDMPVFKRFQAVGGEGNPVDRGSEGSEDLGAGTGRLAVGDPILVPDLGRHGSTETSGGQRRFARATEEPGERADGHKPGRRAGREPLEALG